MSRPPHDRPEQVLYRLAQACSLMLSIACSTTLDPTLDGSVPTLNAGGSGGTSNVAAAGTSAGTSAGGDGERPGMDPVIKPHSLTDCALSMLGDHQYFGCSVWRTFAEASVDCAQVGATLIKVDGSEESALLKGESFAGREWGWIGATRNATFDWSWADGTSFWHGDAHGTAEPGAYTNWNDGEPDNTSDTVRMEERCGTFNVGIGTWVDRYCELVLPYVCELTPAGAAAGGK